MTPTESTQQSQARPEGTPVTVVPATTGATGAAPTSADRFFAAVRRTGLARSRDRWVAGVAGGVAGRLGVDPLVVRVALVVLSLLGGLGLGLYGLAWALLPDAAAATGRIEAQAAQRGDVSGALAVAVGLVVLDLILGQGLLGLGWVL